MAKIQRVTGKIFGGTATATGTDPQIGQFGSALAGTYVGTTDISTIQQLPAWGQGFIGAVTTESQFPALPEVTGFGKVLSQQQCYILQQGVAEWDSETTYYDGSFCSLNRKLYVSLIDENINNNPETDTENWQEFSSGGGGLEIGDIGIAPLGIDETQGKRRYLNGQIIIQEQYQVFADKVKSAIVLYPNLACSEEDWQATVTLSAFGQCGKFVVDDVAGTIRLPKITGFIQGLNNLAILGGLIEAGLPNITGTANSAYFQGDSLSGSDSGSGALSFSPRSNQSFTGQYGTSYKISIDASRSSSIYGNSTTVQPESIKYPYFIQVATGSETEVDIVNEIELNNPYSLFDSKYVEAPLYNISWLLANGTFNGSNAKHPSAYQALLVENNTEIEVGSTVTLPIGTEYTKRGLSVKLSTDSDITDYDFRINTAEETFMLPTKVKLASGKAVVGNGMTLGLTDGTNNCGISTKYDNGNSLYAFSNGYGANIGTVSTITTLPTENRVMGVTTDPTKSGIETSDSDLYLYFYVGETVQNANLINAGRIEEKVASLISNNSSLISSYAMPSNRYIDLTFGASGSSYTAPADGWFCIKIQNQGNTGNYQSGYTTSYGGSGQTTYYGYCSFGGAIVPMLKGQTLTFTYEDLTVGRSIRFVYAQGSESEVN